MDRTPKKPCKHCGLKGHFAYACYQNPKRAIKALKRTELKRTPLKRSTKPINRIGKTTKQWYITRATWIRKNPPPIEGQFWECYLKIHPWCPGRIDVAHLTLDHVVSRSRDPSLRFNLENLKPSCIYCNEMKGSRTLEQIRAEQ
jgi:5-methylcytosine-specific restriction endonuclease McrA